MTYEEYTSERLQALLRYVLMLTGDPHTAADIVQDTMILVQRKWRLVARADSPDRYVKRMLTNAFLDWRRGAWMRRVVLRADLDEPAPVPDHAEQSAERDRVWTLLATLPRRQRAAVVLRYYEGLADAEIAEVMGCAVGTVRGYISRALDALRAELVPAHVTGGGR